MSFAGPIFLWGLAACAIPLIVHLIFRWQTRTLELGTIRFLEELIREQARQKWIRRWLLLALRMLAIAALVLAFARPYWARSAPSGAGQLDVILIDRSASMMARQEQQRLVDLAVARAREIIQALPANTRVELAWFDDQVESWSGQPSERNDASRGDGAARDSALRGGNLRAGGDGRRLAGDWQAELSRLEAPAVLYRGTSYGRALEWARDVILRGQDAVRRVHVLTDLQRSGLDATALEGFPTDVQMEIEAFGSASPPNAALIAVQPSRTLARPATSTTVRATAFNFGRIEYPETPVTLTITSQGRSLRQRQVVTLAPEQAVELEFEVPGLEPGLWEGTIDLDVSDELAFDNRLFFAILVAAQREVVVLDGFGGRGVSDAYLVETALRLTGPDETAEDSPFRVRSLKLDEIGAVPALDPEQLAIVLDGGGLSAADVSRLAAGVERGAGLLVLTGSRLRPDSPIARDESPLSPGAIELPESTRDLPWRWQTWDHLHPLFAPFADPQTGDLRRLAFQTITPVTPRDGTRVLAQFAGDRPALLERQIGQGRVLWLMTSVQRDWGDWTRSRLFLPVLHQLLGDLAGLTGGGPVRVRTLDRPDGPRTSGATAITANDQQATEPSRPLVSPTVPATTATDSALVVNRPGVFRRLTHWDVVNVAPRESDPERCTVEEFEEKFGLTAKDREADMEVQDRSRTSVELAREEWWSWAIIAVVLLLIAEQMIANRSLA